MDIQGFLLCVYVIIVILGHYTFSMQRVTFNLGKEFGVPQYYFDPILPSWLMPFQLILTIGKYGLLLCFLILIYLKEGIVMSLVSVVILFLGAAAVHIILPLFPAHWFFQKFYNNAKYIQEIHDYELGSQYIRALHSSRLF